MKKLSFLALVQLLGCGLLTAQVNNSSYVNASGEKVLQLSVLLPVDKTRAWELFTKDNELERWIAPVAHIELRNGGYILTNYDKSKKLTDSSSIRLPLISYLQNQLLVLKVELNDHFTKELQETDERLQEIIQFDSIAPHQTRITSSMIGWGQGKDWDNAYKFFVRGNIYTYQELLKLF